MHAHAAGFVEFEDELETVLDAIEPALLGVCLDTGHCEYAASIQWTFIAGMRSASRTALQGHRSAHPAPGDR